MTDSGAAASGQAEDRATPMGCRPGDDEPLQAAAANVTSSDAVPVNIRIGSSSVDVWNDRAASHVPLRVAPPTPELVVRVRPSAIRRGNPLLVPQRLAHLLGRAPAPLLLVIVV